MREDFAVVVAVAVVRGGQIAADGRGDAAAHHVVGTLAAHGQVEQAGAGGQVDVLNVLHLRATHRTQLPGNRKPHISMSDCRRIILPCPN